MATDLPHESDSREPPGRIRRSHAARESSGRASSCLDLHGRGWIRMAAGRQSHGLDQSVAGNVAATRSIWRVGPPRRPRQGPCALRSRPPSCRCLEASDAGTPMPTPASPPPNNSYTVWYRSAGPRRACDRDDVARVWRIGVTRFVGQQAELPVVITLRRPGQPGHRDLPRATPLP